VVVDGDDVVDVGVSRPGSQHLPILECLALFASDQSPAPRRSTPPDEVHAAVAVKVHDHDHVNVRMSRRGSPNFPGRL